MSALIATPIVSGTAYLPRLILVRKEDGHNGASYEEVLNFECVEIRVVGWLVIVEHEINGICRGRYEDDFEGCVPQRGRRVYPQQVCLDKQLTSAGLGTDLPR